MKPASAAPSRKRQEACWAHHQSGGARYQPPANHDPTDPAARTHPHLHQVAGNLTSEIGKEKDARAPGIVKGAETQISVHRQSGEADIGAVELVDEEHQRHHRRQPQHDLAHSAAIKLRASSRANRLAAQDFARS